MIVLILCLFSLLTPGYNVVVALDCPESTSSAMPAPITPAYYSFYALVNYKDLNETFMVHEVFSSHTAQQGEPYTFNSMIRGSGANSSYESNIFYDFSIDQSFYIDVKKKSCVVTNLTSSNNQYNHSIFGVGIEKGLSEPLNYTFNWRDPSYNYTKGNLTELNGVPVDHFFTCISFDSGKVIYMVDLYMSADGWEMPHGQNLPVQIDLMANISLSDSKFEVKEYTFTFTSFAITEEDPSMRHWTPSQPRGIVCHANHPLALNQGQELFTALYNGRWWGRRNGRKNEPDLPPLSHTYSVVSEAFTELNSILYSYREWYYYTDKLYRKDITLPRSQNNTFDLDFFTEVHDFHSAVRYRIDKTLGNCKVLPLKMTKESWDIDIESDQTNPYNIHMMDIFKYRDEGKLQYTGRTKHHHGRHIIDVDTWTSIPVLKNITNGSIHVTTTYMYSTKKYSTMANVSPILLGAITTINGTQNNKSIEFNMHTRYSDFSNTKDVYLDPFDISTCFTGDKRKTFVLKFQQSKDMDIVNQPFQFSHELKRAVAKAANVSLPRVWSDIVLEEAKEYLDSKQKYLFAWITLFDTPDSHGNATEYVPQTNLTNAEKQLKAAVTSNRLTVTFKTMKNNGSTARLTAFPSYFLSSKEFYESKPPPQGKGSLTNGVVVGICIGMLILGIILGVVGYHIKAKRSSGQFGYHAQD